jgi:hypothetical protein
MITRSPHDGKTHAGMTPSRSYLGKRRSYMFTHRPGILPRLLSALHSAGILTEDLSLSPDANDNLECTYRGLCIRPAKAGQDKQPRLQRRIGMSQQLVTGPGLIHDQFWCVVDILAIPWESRGAALLYFTVRPVTPVASLIAVLPPKTHPVVG